MRHKTRPIQIDKRKMRTFSICLFIKIVVSPTKEKVFLPISCWLHALIGPPIQIFYAKCECGNLVKLFVKTNIFGR